MRIRDNGVGGAGGSGGGISSNKNSEGDGLVSSVGAGIISHIVGFNFSITFFCFR